MKEGVANVRQADKPEVGRNYSKKIEVRFYDQKVKREYLKLEKKNQMLFQWVKNGIEKLSHNLRAGIQIVPIPKYYLRKFPDIDNLWKLRLPKGWRLLYTVTQDEVRVMAIILEWASHKIYERRLKS